MKVLLTGVSGRLGRLVAQLLLDEGCQVYGIDRRPWPGAPTGVHLYQVDIRKRPAENVFREERPDAVIHLATVTHLLSNNPAQFRINLSGTRAIIEYCHTYGVKQMIFVGRHTYYGANAGASLYHTEDEPPMSVHSFPELADLVAADLYAASAFWRYPEVCSSILRICYTLGPSKRGTLAAFLKGPNVPTVLGFDPLFQFIHQIDATRAIVETLHHKLHGIYNVAGPPPATLSAMIRECGLKRKAVPEPVLNLVMGRFGLPKLPKAALEHLKYPIVVDDSAFRTATGFNHTFDERETLQAFAQS